MLFGTVPETRSPYESYLPWHELSSSSYTEVNAENVSETALIHEPFFEENSTQINVTAQLSNDVILHCRVNDLREKMVRSLIFNCVHFYCQKAYILTTLGLLNDDRKLIPFNKFLLICSCHVFAVK